MAYNFPIGYQQMYYPQQTQQQVNNGIIWVQGENAAKSYPVAPNSSVPLWDSEAQVIYIKSADMSGMPSIRTIDYTIRDAKQADAEKLNFVTKDDFDSLKDEMERLRAKIEKMTDRNKEKRNG